MDALLRCICLGKNILRARFDLVRAISSVISSRTLPFVLTTLSKRSVADDGSFQLDMSYFDYATGLTMTNKKFDALFDGLPRTSETELTQREMDLAASVKKVTEDIVLELAKSIAKETSERNLCLAGGVALNCVANGILLREKIWIQPAAGDAGGALGAALSTWYLHHGNKRTAPKERDAMKGAYLGPEFSNAKIEAELDARTQGAWTESTRWTEYYCGPTFALHAKTT